MPDIGDANEHESIIEITDPNSEGQSNESTGNINGSERQSNLIAGLEINRSRLARNCLPTPFAMAGAALAIYGVVTDNRTLAISGVLAFVFVIMTESLFKLRNELRGANLPVDTMHEPTATEFNAVIEL